MSGCTVDFPIYDITSVDSVRVALCGGGGVVKSGVPNAVVSDTTFSIICTKLLTFCQTLT